jgi:small multidrug resistance pump
MIFGERLTAPILAGIVLIIGGVLMVEFGSHPRTTEDVTS